MRATEHAAKFCRSRTRARFFMPTSPRLTPGALCCRSLREFSPWTLCLRTLRELYPETFMLPLVTRGPKFL
jgi:hypothetical protein